MSRTKRQENGIIIHFIFYLILFLVLIYFIFSYIYPKIIEIENKKLATKELYNSIVALEKSGLSFSEFIELNNNLTTEDKARDLKEILKDIDEDFYKKHLYNNGNLSYDTFLNSKSKYIDNDENKQIFAERDLRLVNILPYYSEVYSGYDENNSLTNFKFVTYVESLLETFNLQNRNGIGIKNLNLIGDYTSKKGTSSALESNIYSIPLKLSLKGKKKGIIDFLHYIENVGKIKVENNNLEILNDGYFLNGNIATKLAGDNLESNYNIYKHQIIDIGNIKIQKYLDTSLSYRGQKISFVDFIKQAPQGNEEIEVDINLFFYVRGYPHYKIEEYIEETLKQYATLQTDINNALNTINENDYKLLKIKNASEYLKSISKDIVEIRKDSNNIEKVEIVFKKAVEFKSQFNNIEKLIK